MQNTTIYLFTSTRKNARCVYKSFIEKDYRLFDINDICDMISFISYQKDTHKYIEIITYDTINRTAINRQGIYSIEPWINTIYGIFRQLNFVEFDYTLAELYDNPNIKYLINQYYHGRG
jgi:hypothetical protein